jgi:hypothetical protein
LTKVPRSAVSIFVGSGEYTLSTDTGTSISLQNADTVRITPL